MPAGLVFTIGFVLLCCAYEYGRVLHLRPQPHHIFRQCDCLGMTWNYAFTDPDLFEPRMCNLHADHDTTGRTAAEFPVLYWGVGMLWRAFGQSEFLYRLIMVLLHFGGSYALFLTARRLTRSAFWGIWTSLLFFTSPAIVYFGISFLPDVPALDLALMGCWWAVRYLDRQRRWDLVIAMAFTSLAMLLKITAGFLFVAAWGVLAAETLLWRRAGRRFFPQRGFTWACFIGAVVPVVAWYAWSAQYNQVHGNPFTNTGMSHYWLMSAEEAATALRFARTILVFEIFSLPVWLVFLGAFVLLAVAARRLPWQVVLFHGLLLFGLVLYLIGWAQALNNHDYYFTCPQLVLMALLITVIAWYGRQEGSWLRTAWARGLALLLLGWSVLYAAVDVGLRTRNGLPVDRSVVASCILNDAQLEHWRSAEYWKRRGQLDVEPYARSLGITRQDRILITVDRSWQVGLYLAGQTGWSDYTVGLEDSLSMARAVHVLRPSYLYLTEPSWADRPYMRPYLAHPIGHHPDVDIYDLRPLQQAAR